MVKHTSTIRVKSRRGRKITKLGDIIDRIKFPRPVDMRGSKPLYPREFIDAAKKALNGDTSLLLRMLGDDNQRIKALKYLANR